MKNALFSRFSLFCGGGGEAIAPPHPLQTVMPMYSDFGGIYTFSWIKTAVMTIIDHEKHNCRHLNSDVIMLCFQDINENRDFGNGVTNLVFLAGEPRMRPGSNAFF